MCYLIRKKNVACQKYYPDEQYADECTSYMKQIQLFSILPQSLTVLQEQSFVKKSFKTLIGMKQKGGFIVHPL